MIMTPTQAAMIRELARTGQLVMRGGKLYICRRWVDSINSNEEKLLVLQAAALLGAVVA